MGQAWTWFDIIEGCIASQYYIHQDCVVDFYEYPDECRGNVFMSHNPYGPCESSDEEEGGSFSIPGSEEDFGSEVFNAKVYQQTICISAAAAIDSDSDEDGGLGIGGIAGVAVAAFAVIAISIIAYIYHKQAPSNIANQHPQVMLAPQPNTYVAEHMTSAPHQYQMSVGTPQMVTAALNRSLLTFLSRFVYLYLYHTFFLRKNYL